MNNEEAREAAAELERTWQAYLELPYRSKSEYKALVHGWKAATAHHAERLAAVEREQEEMKTALESISGAYDPDYMIRRAEEALREVGESV